MFLLDTNVVSEMRRPRPNPAVIAWIGEAPAQSLFVSAVTCGEIQAGIEKLRPDQAGRADEIERWLEDVMASSALLPMDAACFRAWARLMHGRSDALTIDAMIAATAQVHRLVVATRNVRDFEVLGVSTVDPWTARQS